MTNTFPFDPHGDVFRWGPVPGKFFSVSTFVEVHYEHFRARWGENWAETLFLFRNGRMFWLNETAAVHAAGERIFVRYMIPKESRAAISKEWQGLVGEMQDLEVAIARTNLSDASTDELQKLWNDLHRIYRPFWVTSSVPELANYGSVPYLDRHLRPLITNEQERKAALEVLTAPTRPSFYQEEEIALARAKDLDAHRQQFFWLKNSYAGTQVLSVSFFADRQKEVPGDFRAHPITPDSAENRPDSAATVSSELGISTDIPRSSSTVSLESGTVSAQKRVMGWALAAQIEKKLRATIERKSALMRQYRLSTEIMNMAEAISEGVAWQDERKKHIFIILHHQDLLLAEVARRCGYDFNDLHLLWDREVSDMLAGKDLYATIERRQKGFGVRFFHDCTELSAEETDRFWKAYETVAVDSTTHVQGIVASKGKGTVRGRIRILLDPSRADTFAQGDILVAPMTSPEYIFAMKKAIAIITDTGGLTSHAAIVSRELGVPCIVGTRAATTVFKDGDLVAVDPERGEARKV